MSLFLILTNGQSSLDNATSAMMPSVISTAVPMEPNCTCCLRDVPSSSNNTAPKAASVMLVRSATLYHQQHGTQTRDCHVAEEAFERVRAFHQTAAYKKAMNKRKVWVEPLFAEAKKMRDCRRQKSSAVRWMRIWPGMTQPMSLMLQPKQEMLIHPQLKQGAAGADCSNTLDRV